MFRWSLAMNTDPMITHQAVGIAAPGLAFSLYSIARPFTEPRMVSKWSCTSSDIRFPSIDSESADKQLIDEHKKTARTHHRYLLVVLAERSLTLWAGRRVFWTFITTRTPRGATTCTAPHPSLRPHLSLPYPTCAVSLGSLF